MEQMKNIYDNLITCINKNDNLSEIINILKTLSSRFDSSLSVRLAELENLINNLEKDKSINEDNKEVYEKQFSELFYQHYKIHCEFSNGAIIFNDDEMAARANAYASVLTKYKNIQGFDEGEFNEITENYNDICQWLSFLESVCMRRPDDNNINLKVLDFNPLWRNLELYLTLSAKYEKFINSILLKEFYYILNNTSQLLLTYTNNKFPIKGHQSSSRMFLCQFHSERTPSMRVSINKNFFNCFGCGMHGNQIDYLMVYEKLNYNQAVYLLAEIYLIDILDNPYKNSENAFLVNKYRDVLISDGYRQFLIDSYNYVKETMDGADKLYSDMFVQIERVKAGERDDNFVSNKNSKKYVHNILIKK